MGLHEVAERIEAATELDRVAGPLQRALRRARPPAPVRDVLQGVPLGHPAHPALVVVPIGSWLATSALDLLGGPASRGAARRLVGLGVAAAVPTGAAGAADWVDTGGAERRVGAVHAATNAAAVALMASSWLARRRGRHGLGVALALAGNAAAGGGAWLGGHLSYGLGVGVATTAFTHGPSDWTTVATLGQLVDGEPAGAEAGGVRLVLVRRGGGVDAALARCTHRGGPLDEGTLDGGCLTCPWHGSRFQLADGAVARGPATSPQPVLEVRTVGDEVQVRHRSRRSLQVDAV